MGTDLRLAMVWLLIGGATARLELDSQLGVLAEEKGGQAAPNNVHQPIIISGPGFAGDLSGWEKYKPRDPRDELAADVSSFNYSDYVVAHAQYLRKFARRHPVIVGGFGDTNCTSTYSLKVMKVMDAIRQSYLAWTWDTVQDYGGCANPCSTTRETRNGFPAGYYSVRPSGFGRGVRAHLLTVRP